jgi:hypothetical protein
VQAQYYSLSLVAYAHIKSGHRPSSRTTFEGASNLFLASVCGEAATAMGIVAYRSKAFIDLVDECGHRIAAFDQVLKTGELHL